MVERFNVVSISLFTECACSLAYVVFYAICIVCGDCMWHSKLSF